MSIPNTDPQAKRPSPAVQQFHDDVKSATDKATEADIDLARQISNGDAPRFVEITPMVSAILVTQHNKRNRDLSIAKAIGYSEAMLRGEWKINHQGIAFYPDGTIADGQHRLFGLTLAGLKKPELKITVLACPNFEEQSIDTIDVAKARTVADALQLMGVKDAKIKSTIGASSMQTINLIEEGTKLKNVTVQQKEKFIIENEELLDEVVAHGRESTKNVSEPCLSERDATEVMFVLRKGGYSQSYVLGFVATLQQGLSPYTDSPHAGLARHLVKAKVSGRDKDKITHDMKMALLLKCAKFGAEMKPVPRITWNPKKETFPNNHPPMVAGVGDIETAA